MISFIEKAKGFLPVLGANRNLNALTGQEPPVRGTRELLALYSASPWLRAVVHKVGCAVAEVEWRLYVAKSPEGRNIRNRKLQRASGSTRDTMLKRMLDQDQVEEITDHPLLNLIETGCDQLPGHGVFQTTQSHLDLNGEGYWLLERGLAGVPVGLWPIAPDWVRGIPGHDKPFYKVAGPGTGEIEIPQSEIIRFNDPDPANPYGRGSGTAKALGDELEIDEFSAKHMRSFFYNRARPDLIISGDNMSPEDSKRLEFQWEQRHKGVMRSFRPLFMSRKLDIKELQPNMEQLQMVPIRKHEREAIIQVFGLPPEKLGLLQNSNRATIVAADHHWTKDVLRPRLERLRRTMQRELVPLFDDRIIIDFDTPVARDEEMQLETMKAASHAFTVNDWRKRAGLESAPDGDVYVVPLNSEIVTQGTLKQPRSPAR